MKKERVLLPDILKGFAILMVIVGHCIQEGNGAEFSNNMQYFDDKLYQFIYCFHMPLFAIIAGYFAYPSIKKSEQDNNKWILLSKRVFTYFIPIFVWTLLEYIRECILNTYYGFINYTFFSFISGFIYKLINNHWFLWSMIISFVFIWIMHFYLKDNPIIYTLVFISLFFIPDGFNLHAYKYLLPFYILSYYVNQYSFFMDIFKKKINIFLPLFFFLFVILFIFYRKEIFIYVSGYRITKNIWWQMIIIDVYRFIIGLVGSAFFIMFFYKLTLIFNKYKFPVLSLFGKYSLGIYLISGYSTILIMRRFTDTLSYNIPRVFLESAVISFFSLIISIIVSKIPYINKIIGK